MSKIGLIFIFLAVVSSSCNYKAAAINIDGQSVIETSIPVIKKDANGYLRNFVAEEMSNTTCLDFKQWEARYELKISIVEDGCSKISFMWDRVPSTNVRKDVFYNSEGMREIIAKVELYDTLSNRAVIEPFYLKATADYDFVNPTNRSNIEFDNDGADTSILQYSLGQLDSEEGAKSESYRVAYKKLAKKIVRRLVQTTISTES